MDCCRFFPASIPLSAFLCLCSSLLVFRCSCLDAAALCRTNVLRLCSLFARCRRLEPLFPSFHRHAGCVGPSVLCLRLAAFCIGHPVFRLLPLPFNGRFIIRFQLFVCFFVRSCSFVNRVWAGHLADELLVRALERCDWFARLLRPPPLCKYKQIYNINQIFDHISYLYSRSQEGLFPCDRLVISLAYGLYGAGIDLIMLFFVDNVAPGSSTYTCRPHGSDPVKCVVFF